MKMNMATILTFLRILVIPIIVIVYYLPKNIVSTEEANLIATIIFILAAITDWLDGYIARKYNQTSKFGEFLDPVADKLLVAVCLVMLNQLGRAEAFLVAIIISREITISALREWMAKIGANKSVAVSMLGKVKTTAQMVSIPMLLLNDKIFGIDTLLYGHYFLIIAAALTLWSMFFYFEKAFKEIKERNLF